MVPTSQRRVRRLHPRRQACPFSISVGKNFIFFLRSFFYSINLLKFQRQYVLGGVGLPSQVQYADVKLSKLCINLFGCHFVDSEGFNRLAAATAISSLVIFESCHDLASMTSTASMSTSLLVSSSWMTNRAAILANANCFAIISC